MQQYYRQLVRKLFWNYRYSDIKDIVSDIKEYAETAIGNGENEDAIIDKLGHPDNMISEIKVDEDKRLGIIRKLMIIPIIAYIGVVLLSFLSYIITFLTYTFSIVIPVLFSFVMYGEFKSSIWIKQTPRYLTKLLYGLVAIIFLFQAFNYTIIKLALENIKPLFIQQIINNFTPITRVTFYLLIAAFSLVVVLTIIMFLSKKQHIIFDITLLSGAISTLALIKEYMRDISSPQNVLDNILRCLLPLIISITILLVIRAYRAIKKVI